MGAARIVRLNPDESFQDANCIASACIAPTEGGQIFANADVRDGAGTWTATDVGNLNVSGVTCASLTRCYALGYTRGRHGWQVEPSFLLYSDNPFATAPTWHSARVPTSGKTRTYDYDCPTADTCLVELATPGRHHTVKGRIVFAHLPSATP